MHDLPSSLWCNKILHVAHMTGHQAITRQYSSVIVNSSSCQGVVGQLGAISVVCAAVAHCCHIQAEGTAEAGTH